MTLARLVAMRRICTSRALGHEDVAPTALELQTVFLLAEDFARIAIAAYTEGRSGFQNQIDRDYERMYEAGRRLMTSEIAAAAR